MELNWKVAGYAGEGIMTTGLLFSKACARHGLNIFDYTEYPSLIRGGHNTYQVLASHKPVHSQKKLLDLLIALNKNALSFHKQELNENSLVVFDQEDDKIDIKDYSLPGIFFNLPMVRLAEESGAPRVMANNVALGASMFFLGLDIEILENLIKDIFGKKGEAVISLNKKAARSGYDYAQQNGKPLKTFEKKDQGSRITITGNEAAGLGAIAGGLHCYIAYPMTPSSSVLHYLAAVAKKAGIVVKHAEDEISVVNMALGSSFAGARTMIGTSGGGFCYMTEALGLSGVAEIPLVVYEAMRPGPALGMPTWTAQGDIQFLINASQDEFPRFVLTPGDGEEIFTLTKEALTLAEKFHTLVIIATDKHLAESRHTFSIDNPRFAHQRYSIENNPEPDETGFFPRYKDTETGVSPRSLPGTAGGIHVANSYDHDQYGLATEVASTRTTQMEKRFKKQEKMKEVVPQQFYEEQDGAQITFISFGSSKGAIKAAREQLNSQNIFSNQLHISWLWPFPSDQVKRVIESSSSTLIVEGNFEGQLSKLITQETGILLNNHLRKYDGRPFYPEEIVDHVINLNK